MQLRRDRRILAVGDQPQGRLANPAVGVGQVLDQLGRAEGREIAWPGGRGGSLRTQPVNPSRRGVDLALMIAVMADLAIVPVGDVERTVGASRDVDRAKPRVRGRDGVADVVGPQGRTIGNNLAHHDVVEQGSHAEEDAPILFGQGVGLVDQKSVRESGHAVVLHGGEVAKGVGVRERSMLVEAFLEIGPLHVVKSPRVASVVSREDASLGVDLHAERVAAPLGKDLVASGFGVIAPDQLPHRVHRLLALVEARARHVAGHRRSLGRVDPAVGTPAQAVHNRVRVFQTKALEVNFGVAVGDVIVVAIGIE